MSKIEIDGFLSEESEKGRKNFYLKYRDVFDFAKRNVSMKMRHPHQ